MSKLTEIAVASVDPDRIPLRDGMRIARCSRSTFYRHAEIPRYRVKGRVYTSRAAAEALARRRGIEVPA